MGSPPRKCSTFDGTEYKDAPTLTSYHQNGKLLELNDNGDVLMIAGQNSRSVELLKDGEGAWEVVSSIDVIPKNGYFHFTAARVGTKYIYTFGGWEGTSGMKSVYKMNVNTFEWSVHDQEQGDI